MTVAGLPFQVMGTLAAFESRVSHMELPVEEVALTVDVFIWYPSGISRRMVAIWDLTATEVWGAPAKLLSQDRFFWLSSKELLLKEALFDACDPNKTDSIIVDLNIHVYFNHNQLRLLICIRIICIFV